MMPQAPAADTADASRLRAIQPIGACTIGISTPRWRDTRLSNAWWANGTSTVCRGVFSRRHPCVAEIDR